MVEAARGHYVYVNLWSQRPARPYDLAAAVALVRGAGGDVTDLDGVALDAEQPAGPWIASLDDESRVRVAALVKAAWRG